MKNTLNNQHETKRMGEFRLNKQGRLIEIIDYRNATDVDVLLDNGMVLYNRTYWEFKNGTIKYPECLRIGEEKINNQGLRMKIIDYTSCRNMTILFDDGTILYNVEYGNFKNGSVTNYNHKDIFGVACRGYGKHKNWENSRCTDKYNTWVGMLERCYSDKLHNKRKTYLNCSTVDEWLNFQTFGDWYDLNYTSYGSGKMCLDKDILVKGNKIYSPQTCVFVDDRINALITKNESVRGLYPIGVTKIKNKNQYLAQCRVLELGRQLKLGKFDTPEEAFYVYKQFKEKYIKQVADEYKEKYPNFPQKLYDALYSYQVEIDD